MAVPLKRQPRPVGLVAQDDFGLGTADPMISTETNRRSDTAVPIAGGHAGRARERVRDLGKTRVGLKKLSVEQVKDLLDPAF